MDMTLKGRFKQSIRECSFNTIKVHLVLLSIQVAFSIFYIVAKLALKNMEPFVFLMLRLLMATPLLWALAFATSRAEMFILPTKRQWILLAVSGLFSVTVNQSLFLVGLGLSTASMAAITQPAIPIFSTIFGVFLGYEKKTLLKFIGIGVAVVGAILMIDFTHLVSDSSTSKQIVLGNLCFLGNTLAYAIFLLSQKPLVEGKDGMSSSKCMAWCFLIGTPPCVAIGLGLSGRDIGNQLSAIDVGSWLSIVYTAIFATAYTFFASSWAVKHSDPTTVSVYLTVEPLLTALLAAIILHERLTILNVIGGIVILIGVGAVMVSKFREKKKLELDAYEKQKLKAMEEEELGNSHIDLLPISSNNNNKQSLIDLDNFNNGGGGGGGTSALTSSSAHEGNHHIYNQSTKTQQQQQQQQTQITSTPRGSKKIITTKSILQDDEDDNYQDEKYINDNEEENGALFLRKP
ncbi:hypothetical protein CYY_004534 [Polysphondylium violaceum]|uniref:EamA domain-containing protein n=1 Tax=Polysphondylium violaceum TaxID=133409 RepID=A0A8J4PT80_9MYCE|nr:hypothetical protein CYY_004534 [Polysphondylium violaceum]